MKKVTNTKNMLPFSSVCIESALRINPTTRSSAYSSVMHTFTSKIVRNTPITPFRMKHTYLLIFHSPPSVVTSLLSAKS